VDSTVSQSFEERRPREDIPTMKSRLIFVVLVLLIAGDILPQTIRAESRYRSVQYRNIDSPASAIIPDRLNRRIRLPNRLSRRRSPSNSKTSR